jgi:hypothetical protein
MSHQTWTKNKSRDRVLLFEYLHSVENVTIKMQHKDFPFRGIWRYDIHEVPNNKLGKLYKYRGLKVLRFSIVYTIQVKDTMMCFPIDHHNKA